MWKPLCGLFRSLWLLSLGANGHQPHLEASAACLRYCSLGMDVCTYDECKVCPKCQESSKTRPKVSSNNGGRCTNVCEGKSFECELSYCEGCEHCRGSGSQPSGPPGGQHANQTQAARCPSFCSGNLGDCDFDSCQVCSHCQASGSQPSRPLGGQHANQAQAARCSSVSCIGNLWDCDYEACQGCDRCQADPAALGKKCLKGCYDWEDCPFNDCCKSDKCSECPFCQAWTCTSVYCDGNLWDCDRYLCQGCGYCQAAQAAQWTDKKCVKGCSDSDWYRDCGFTSCTGCPLCQAGHPLGHYSLAEQQAPREAGNRTAESLRGSRWRRVAKGYRETSGPSTLEQQASTHRTSLHGTSAQATSRQGEHPVEGGDTWAKETSGPSTLEQQASTHRTSLHGTSAQAASRQGEHPVEGGDTWAKETSGPSTLEQQASTHRTSLHGTSAQAASRQGEHLVEGGDTWAKVAKHHEDQSASGDLMAEDASGQTPRGPGSRSLAAAVAVSRWRALRTPRAALEAAPRPQQR